MIEVVVLGHQRFDDFVADNYARERHVSRGRCFGEGDEVRANAVVFGREPRAEAAKAGDDFIREQQDAVLVDDALNFRPIAVGRDLDAARALHRLGGNRRDVLRSAAQNFVFEGARGAKAEGFGRLAVEGFPIPVGIHDVAEAFVNRIAMAVDVAHAAHRSGGDRRSVIGVVAADDDAPLRFALQHPVVADETDGGVVRFRARRAEEDLIEICRCQFRELARQRDDGRMRRLEERIVERQLQHLIVGGLGEFLAAVADVGRPKPRHAVEDAVAFAIEDIGAFAFDDDAWTGTGAQRLVCRERVQMMLRVELLNLFCLKSVGHGAGLQRS